MNKLKSLVLIFILFFGAAASAQQTLIHTHGDPEFSTAIELYQKEKFGAAQKSFVKVIGSHNDPNSLVRIDAEYYNAICAIELFNKDGELYLKQFVNDHPESPKVKSAYFYLGKYNYRKKKWRDAIDWFQKVDIYDLTTEELSEFYFKRGYSYFITEKYAEAKKDLYEIKDVDNSYAGAAKYYYAHIAYTEKNYETALTDFLKLQQNETFGPVVPYYIAQLYYLHGKYDQVISYAPALLDSANTKRAPEIARVLGESYYRQGKYSEAIPFLKRYEKSVGKLPRADQYELGYAFYKVKDYDEAVNYFTGVTNLSDSLVQNAYYHLGDCYLKLNNKQNARNAFSEASKLDFDKKIQEDALYSYAKLCYELAYNPYNEAIKAFQQYIKNYPNSPKIDEAYTFLVNVFTTTRNYKGAIEAIEAIKVPTPELKQAHQKVAYYRGVDQYNNSEYADAIKSFEKATTYKFDKEISALAVYWKGESYYRLKNYTKAIDAYLAYIAEPGSIGTSGLSDANYNIAYSYYKLKEYEGSNLWFRKFVTFKPMAEAKKINDALNRIGDGYFMQNDYANAADYYDQSYKMKLINADYALFQKAMANGVLKRYPAKISDLQTFISSYSTSSYIQKAKFELALTYEKNGQGDLALTSYKKFMDEYPSSLYMNTALSKVGLIYFLRNDDDNALAYFDKLIKRDRKSPEAAAAIDNVKKIYTSKGNVQGLETYLASIGATIPQMELDSLSFTAGRNHYDAGEYKTAVADFENYLKKFPEGFYLLPVHAMKADADDRLGNTDAALTGYSYVISKNKSEFTEHALYRGADISYKKQNYPQALDWYKQLEQVAEDPKNVTSAKVGLMRVNYQLKNNADAVLYANKVLALENPGKELKNEAHYNIAQVKLAEQKYDEAFAEFKALSNTAKNEMGAEAGYNVAYIYYLKNEYKQSQKAIYDFIGENDYDYWVSKAFILLADNFVALKDNFQAKTTLKTVINDSKTAELIKTAQEKLDKIIADEEAAKQSKMMSVPDQIEFQGDTTEQKKLFNESNIPGGGENKNE
ncbi:MAG TPA: tetratricopeptide repeat protein [Bacteroidia bacterium]|jgi:tetratricopeptide (TPR) repeat protein